MSSKRTRGCRVWKLPSGGVKYSDLDSGQLSLRGIWCRLKDLLSMFTFGVKVLWNF